MVPIFGHIVLRLPAYSAISITQKPHVVPSPSELFPASREAGFKRLADFVPHAGRAYAAERNADAGPGLRENVSMLSPYIRYRVISEREVVAAVLEQHTSEQAEKFIQEVFWRTYWKGWLQMRPQVWADFLAERDRERARADGSSGLSKALADAEAGCTGIECFDDWAQELVATGYLHNHTRMWFASIWIFTLKLPWVLGADFFLRNLIDADPASNTLSWRWVAGIQTRGKTYLARPDNIAKYTNGRYQPTGLATEALPIRDEAPYSAELLEPLSPIPNVKNAMLLLHAEDFAVAKHIPKHLELADVVIARAASSTAAWPFGDKAKAFIDAAAQDMADYTGELLDHDVGVLDHLDAASLIERARSSGADIIITPEAPVGPINSALVELSTVLSQHGISLYRFRRDWDAVAWPLAIKGFFPFKKAIPQLLTRAGLV